MIKFFIECWGRLIVMITTLYTFGTARTNMRLGISFGLVLVVIMMILWTLVPIYDKIQYVRNNRSSTTSQR